MSSYKIAVVVPRMLNRETGGAERFFTGLVNSLNTTTTSADIVEVLIDESSFESIQESYLRCYDLDVSAYDGVISTKAPTFLLRHPNHICYLVHTMRVFYDMFEQEFGKGNQVLKTQRETIQQLDTGALRPPRTKKVFTIGNEVSQRLMQWNGVKSEVLHPALVLNNFSMGKYDHIFLPGRLHRWKRVDLVIKAMAHLRYPMNLKIAGTGEQEQELRTLSQTDKRIEFLGRVSDEELLNLYANALVVPFVPIREDYGYVTLEAFSHFKPVITCQDSGESLQFVKDGINGLVVSPKPKEIARAIEYFINNPEQAKIMGERGKIAISHINWSNISQRLLSVLQNNNE
ncbi:glycosyltransferase family 4 protein [Umezakia ovalisporum]|uniref:Glycosyltransferase family 4 protein n=1 Tax=Umezakia ovalisporum FSS-43 TaxID=2740520 RepID=A0ABT6K8Q3_9CYAN|nr:glycosyltransferase family 4 protein [Umezakia ovalisporum]MDH6058372.1 glycosyltransferase family 4 protein [Umezakia ovalisporum FSS-43]MDH6067719.1 glycosyltransferase family 4 protein [Umezakia ovalisporum APH033B]MDH6071519.1 glycosyltransferase family 4 protein [Umezakia ovalisporum CobakiLakeA]MDH6073139.1 glycosyltransferase family 4 protein [Umezakia ovalisporum CS-1034]MDH6082825.1 glycosyltransferase family 4 protein [Umezakia ovalisporum FSS-44]